MEQLPSESAQLSSPPIVLTPSTARTGRWTIRPSVREAWVTIRTSSNWALVVRWYLAWLLLTMFAKYFSTQWGEALKFSVQHGGLAGRIERAVHTASVVFSAYRADVVEVWLLIGVLFLLGHTVARIRPSVLAWISLSVSALIAFACWLALSQTGMPLTYGTVLIGLRWSWQHPEVIPTVVPWPRVVVVTIIALAYGALPVVTSMRWSQRLFARRVGTRVTEASSLLALALLLLVLLTPGRLVPAFTSSLSPIEGYWSSAIVALADVDRESPVNLVSPRRTDLLRDYRRVAYPLGRPDADSFVAIVPPGPAKHVVIVALRTAPNAYYALTRDSTLPTFATMSRSAIVSNHHFTTRTYTLLAIYGMITGTYPRPGSPIGEFGDFRNDGLAATLGRRGFETTYIDSYRVDWGYHYRAELKQQGFTTILDTAGFRAPHGIDPFSAAVAREHWSFQQALARIAAAKSHGTKALVVVATTLGHFPWRAPRQLAGASSPDKLHHIAREFDGTFAAFLRGLDSLSLRDSTIIVVTGDHGLRYKAEFDSFGDSARPADVDFNVPFLLYAPGQISRRIDLPHPTSHVDIAPTIYALLGIPTDSMMLHGENMLDARLAHRATYLMNTGLNPNDGFIVAGHRFESNSITREVRAIPPISFEPGGKQVGDMTVPALLADANHVFNLTAAYFLVSHSTSAKHTDSVRAQPAIGRTRAASLPASMLVTAPRR